MDDARVRLDHQPLEFVLGQEVGPAVEQLQDVRAGGRLQLEVPRGALDQHLDQGVHPAGIGDRQGPGLAAVAAGAALDHVGGHRPGRAGEAYQRPLGLQFLAYVGQGLANR